VRRAGWIVALVCLAALLGPTPTAQQRGDQIRCVVTVSTATTITAVGGDCAARPQMALNITAISFSTNAAGIAADSFNTLKYGTGTTCGTGTAVFWAAMSTAAVQTTTFQHFPTPLRLPQAVDVCWINSTAGSKFLVITGYYTP